MSPLSWFHRIYHCAVRTHLTRQIFVIIFVKKKNVFGPSPFRETASHPEWWEDVAGEKKKKKKCFKVLPLTWVNIVDPHIWQFDLG
jgi:hypothetical protein